MNQPILLFVLFAAAVAWMAANAAPPEPGRAPQAAQAQQQAPGVVRRSAPPVVMIVPREVDAMQNFANGCWVRLYDGKDYQGEWVTLVGPVDLPSLQQAGASHIDGFESLQVGPGARLNTYRDAGFQSMATIFEANDQVPDLSRIAPPNAGRIDTVRVSCGA